jgi:hypothetical protein
VAGRKTGSRLRAREREQDTLWVCRCISVSTNENTIALQNTSSARTTPHIVVPQTIPHPRPSLSSQHKRPLSGLDVDTERHKDPPAGVPTPAVTSRKGDDVRLDLCVQRRLEVRIAGARVQWTTSGQSGKRQLETHQILLMRCCAY